MIQILRSVAASGTVTATEFADLKKILSQATTLNIPGYVQVLAGDVVNGNAANATYQGRRWATWPSAAPPRNSTNLIGKWFLGTDHPALCDTSLVYKSVAGSLLPAYAVAPDEVPGRAGRLLFHFRPGHAGRQQPRRRPEHVHQQRRRHVHRPLLHEHLRHHRLLQRRRHQRRLHQQQGTADYVTVDSMLPAAARASWLTPTTAPVAPTRPTPCGFP